MHVTNFRTRRFPLILREPYTYSLRIRQLNVYRLSIAVEPLYEERRGSCARRRRIEYRSMPPTYRRSARESLLECWNSQTEDVLPKCNIYMFLTELMCIRKKKETVVEFVVLA